ncbi:ras-like protein 1 [Acropora palmata]
MRRDSNLFMSLRRKSIPESGIFTTSTMRHPLTFTPPRQRKQSFSGRASAAGVISYSADRKLLPSRRRSNSLGGKDHDLSPSKLDSQAFKKRPSLLGSKLKLGSKETDHAVSNRTEKHSIVMLGAGGVGKTALVVRFVTGRFLNEYDPTLEMVYEKDITVAESTVSLDILDTATNTEATYIRTGESFIVVYSITDHYSFEVARQMVKLIREVRKQSQEEGCQVPVILIGNKRDLRRGRQVSKEEARETAEEFSCSHYETSALTNKNVQIVFLNMVFHVRINKQARQKAQGSSGNNGFFNSVRQLLHRRSSLPS